MQPTLTRCYLVPTLGFLMTHNGRDRIHVLGDMKLRQVTGDLVIFEKMECN